MKPKKPIKSTKVHNAKHGWKAKVEIRQRVMGEIGGPEKARVFDVFAGPGVMWAEVWKHAAHYVGCDQEWFRDDRLVYVADNVRVLRCVDLSPFNIFDLDAFGSPWEQALIIAARRRVAKGERIGFIFTEGTSLKTRFGQLPKAMSQAAGISANGNMGIGRWHDEIIARSINGVLRRMNCVMVKQWKAIGLTGAQVRYIGVVAEGTGVPEAVTANPAPKRPKKAKAPAKSAVVPPEPGEPSTPVAGGPG
jgi:hypothetical protein